MLPTTRRGETPFELMQREFDRLMDPWSWRGNGGQVTAAYPVDIYEDDNAVHVEAELPGFKKDEITVTMEQGILTINAARKESEKQGEEHLTERRYMRVSRSFRLPTPVDENAIEAHLEDGVLKLALPKREEVKPRRIEVK